MSISCGCAVELCAKDTRGATKYGCGDGFSCGKTYNTQLSRYLRDWYAPVWPNFVKKLCKNVLYGKISYIILLYIYIYTFAGEALLTSRIPLYYTVDVARTFHLLKYKFFRLFYNYINKCTLQILYVYDKRTILQIADQWLIILEFIKAYRSIEVVFVYG